LQLIRVGFLLPAKVVSAKLEVYTGLNRTVGIMGWYEEFLFTAAAVCYSKCANVPNINHQSSVVMSSKTTTSVDIVKLTPV